MKTKAISVNQMKLVVYVSRHTSTKNMCEWKQTSEKIFYELLSTVGMVLEATVLQTA